MSPATLAGDLAGPGVTVSNVTYKGANAQAGRIHVLDPAVVSFNDGVIMSSGNIADVAGPNKSDGITGDMAGPADADLNTLIANTQTVNPVTFDAASLEFDFVPQASQVYFTYTFGSDEYLEWVNQFNDVFGFFVNGQNCATVPSGDPVSIDAINSAVNPQLFRDNSFSAPVANPINIESDGLSVEMVCSAPVNPGVVNHLKLAIADTSDQILDSVVMIKANSLSTTKPESCNDHVDNNDDTLVDMNDPTCSGSTTPAPIGSSGVGSSGNPPPFTGNEGTPINLDASALGWKATPDTVNTSWTVNGINGTTGSCTVSPTGPTPLNADGSIAMATTTCPNEGEYVARVDGWDVEGKSAFDMDVDFFVHNAPPSVAITSPVNGASVVTGTPVDVSAAVTDKGAGDSVTCSINWGDGLVEPGVLNAGTCSGSHPYADAGSKVVSVTATDNSGDSSAGAVVVNVTAAPANTPPTASAGTTYVGTEGKAIKLIGATSDAEGDVVTSHWDVTATSASAGSACVVKNAAALITTVICNDNGSFAATLTASDGKASTVSAPADVTVANALPTVAITAPTTGSIFRIGTDVAVSATVKDLGANDVLACSVNWGDGSVISGGVIANGICTANHTYSAPATRRIAVTVADDDAGTRIAYTKVTIPASTGNGSGVIADTTFLFTATGKARPVGTLSTSTTTLGQVFASTTTTAMSFNANGVIWSGAGTWNGKAGYLYQATAIQNGPGGDAFAITVTKKATGAVIFQRNGDLASGSVTVVQ